MSIAALIREAISKGCNTPRKIKEYAISKGVYTLNDSVISLALSGKKQQKLAIPYSKYESLKHLETFESIMDKLRKWVDNDIIFRSLLKNEIDKIDDLNHR